jgi:hypothetical protein
MISRTCLFAALLCCAAAGTAQQPAPQAPPAAAPPSPAEAAVQQTATAFGQCVMAGIQGVAATVTPEAGATSVLAGCATQRQGLERAVDAHIATIPAAQQAGAREQFRGHMAGAEGQIAAAITRRRVAPAAAQQ